MKLRPKVCMLFVLLAVSASLVFGVGSAAAVSFARSDLATGAGPWGSVVADFNWLGGPDLAVANARANSVTVYLGDTMGGFRNRTDYPVGAWPDGIAAGDFDRDGATDLAVANRNDGDVSILLGNGSGGFGDKTDYPVGYQPACITVADFNGDQFPDLAVTNWSSSSVSVLLGNGSGGFGAKTDIAVAGHPWGMAFGDLGGRAPDLLVACGADAVGRLRSNGDGSFATRPAIVAGPNPRVLAIADLNRDGGPDLAVANQDYDSVTVVLGDGRGGFGKPATFATGARPYGMAVGDLDGDGKLDVVTANAVGNSLSVLLGDGKGSLATPVAFATGVMPMSVAIADFDQDGRQDLVAESYASNAVSVFLNTTPTASMKIDRGAAETSDHLVTVDSSAARDVTEMRVRDRGGAWSDWRPYAARTSWTLASSDGVRAVEAQYRNATDRSAVVSDTILLDAHAPTLRLASRTVRMSMRAGELRLRLRWNDAVSRRARLLARVTQYGDSQQERYSVPVARRGRWQVVSTPWKAGAPGSYRLHLVLRDQVGHDRRVSALVVVSR